MASFTQAWRALARRRTFTTVTLLTLALGIGLTTTTFSIVNGVLLRPLPFPDGDRLVSLYEASPSRGQRASLIAPARLEDWHRLNRTFVAMAGSYTENITDTSGGEPERLAGRRVTPRFFEVFAMTALRGRTFTASEEAFGGPTVAVISEDFWTRRFQRRDDAIGSRLVVSGVGYTIVGVMPRAFATGSVDAWLPAQLAPGLAQIREARFLSGVARLKPGVTIAQARDDLARVQADLAAAFPRTDRDWSADVRDLKDVRVGEYRRPLLVVFAAVGLLFAIAVANVAGLVFVQLHRRGSEFAIRAAIGASRAQIALAIMREMSLLALGGAVLGAAAAYWMTQIAAARFLTIPRMGEVALDGRALAFVAGASAIATLVFGMAPALVTANGRPAAALSSVGRGVTGGRPRLQTAIVVAQLALGLVLAGTAALLVRSYVAMTRADGGFATDGVLTFHVAAAWDEDRLHIGQLQTRLLEQLQSMPGVRAAGFTNFLPATGATLRYQVIVDGLSGEERGGAFTVGQRTISDGYPAALRLPLLSGSWCHPTKSDFGANVVRDALVNRAFVERFAQGQNLAGRGLRFTQGAARFQITGVVGDVREDGPAAQPVPFVYLCLPAGAWPDPEYVVRVDGDARALIPAIRAALKTADPSRPLFGVKPLADVVDAALDQPRLNATALAAFATAAIALAALGLYGLLTLLVSQRRRELGVRMALGATPRELASVVIGGAARLVVPGLVIGMALLFVAGRFLRALLFGVGPHDMLAVAGATAALGVASTLAILIPVRQAASVGVADAMRLE